MKPSPRLLTALALALTLPAIQAQETPKEPQRPAMTSKLPVVAADKLEARLEKVRFDSKSSTIGLEFVLTNRSEKEAIQLCERWNSWGSKQWSFTAKTAAGQELEFSNAIMNWWANSPTCFTIEPGKEFPCPCTLALSDTAGNVMRSHTESLYLAYHGPAPAPPYKPGSTTDREFPARPTWSFPLKLTGHFKAVFNRTINHDGSDGMTNWKGEIKTAELTVKEKEE
ncbi:hypothetical protein [Haloferula sp. BvORR071]|uniref:hypothetical protein n=1 Tax=Haloferula sp. BvORR071 TaxID=1396141 RepID=UPI000555EE56|nr:hypothetical protein [Haloferula sp. BvORR071]